ncbi:MAG: hypothetical protein LBH36_01125 [Candidatus Nomurabacteria bacterium]|jgi:hypothetical protein|nr:hypothetical protein [Candidatus Nomurabacteria bacterium]
MDDKQYLRLVKYLDKKFDEQHKKVLIDVKEAMSERFKDVDDKLDWIADQLDADEKERLAPSAGLERKVDNHERRITKLEKAAV